ncbi:MAG: ATP-binding protein [Candidatus Omnitrophica bacterium]|nr:ATP-binding protein [Candidatus Omnitrophota bacterium]
MQYISRLQEEVIRKALARDKSVLLLGARQTGKTTLVHQIKSDLAISFVRPDIRQTYEKNPAILVAEVEALEKKGATEKFLIILDEIQKVPEILDVVQDLIDRKKASFILTGSSARKLRRGSHVNLLPGRVVALKLDPLTLAEASAPDLRDRLLFGSLPGILTSPDPRDREKDLESYVTTYLEEEIRAEAIVRNLGSFARFLEYAASESGQVVNLRKLSQEIGVSHTTIGSYYEILEDCLIAERIEPLTKSKTRKKLTKSHKYLFFDLGVRRLAARVGTRLPREEWGRLFEQFVGLELLRCARLSGKKIQIKFWRDPDGPEVDWVMDVEDHYIPLEVKWTQSPTPSDMKHLKLFLSEYSASRVGYLVCQTPRKLKFAENIFALPWQDLDKLILDK